MQNYRLLFTENNTNDRYLILLNISALKCPDSDTVATDLQEITDHLAIYQSGKEGIKELKELFTSLANEFDTKPNRVTYIHIVATAQTDKELKAMGY